MSTDPKQRPLLVTAAVIQDSLGRFLITKRPIETKIEPGRWEFPGGKMEYGMRPEECLVQAIQDEIGVAVSIGALITAVSHVYTYPGYPSAHVVILFYLCRYEGGIPKRLSFTDHQWTDSLHGFDFTESDRPVVEILRGFH